jgi:serine protease AprX
MFSTDVHWIRQNGKKFSPSLRRKALDWNRPIRFIPCFMQSLIKKIIRPLRKVPVIVHVERGGDGMSINSVAAVSGCRIKKSLPVINAFSAKVSEKALKSLAENAQVKKIWHDTKVKAILDIASEAVGATPLWSTDVTGKDVVVAVLDTGIYEHPDLSGRIIAFKDFIKNRTKPYDDNGHGTHVAGDIASDGSSSNNAYRAPAPEAKLVGVKVLDRFGSGYLSDVIDGVQWCIDNKDRLNISVINMSLGGQAMLPYAEDPLCLAVEAAWNSGIVVCAAAGNEGPEHSTIATPGIDPLVITVGATDDLNTAPIADDTVAGFSSRGPTIDGLVKPDVLSPGTSIVSLRAPGSFLDKQTKKSRIGKWYVSLSGTSMATPVCSGVVAQILQVNPALTPDEVKSLLTSTSSSLQLDPNIQGAGIINAQKAVESISA